METHGRAATAAQICDLEIVPRRTITHGSQHFEEMDLDAVLTRRPRVALVDELAHTDVPGSRNEKRWQDIEQLLAAGITVISTLNIQHLESLNDVVQRITGVVQLETVPDAWVRMADQIELLDITPEALRRRMAHGHIYEPEQVDAALGHHFRVGNLGALRGLALLWVADRVDETLQDYRERHGVVDAWETRERVVVALTGAPAGEQLVRRGARMAARSHAALVGVHVRSADGLAGPNLERLEGHRRLLEDLGGRYTEVTGTDTADALVQFARAENATQLVLGSSQRSRWAEATHGSVINRVIRDAGSTDVHVISEDEVEGVVEVPRTRRGRERPVRPPRALATAWILAVVLGPLAALALTPLRDTVGVAAMLLLLLLDPIVVALLGGLAPAVAAAVMTFLFADWLYVPPIHAVRIQQPTDGLALLMFVAVAIVVSVLVDRLARRTAQLTRIQTESDALAELASSTVSLEPTALTHLTEELRSTLGFDAVAVLSPTSEAWRVEASAGEPVPARPEEASYAAELTERSVLVVAGPILAADERRLLSAFVAQLRLAQSALRLHTEAQRGRTRSRRSTAFATRSSPQCLTTCVARSPTSRPLPRVC